MKDKIGLISVRNHNYGSILQAYAFQRVLFQKGIENEIIYYEKTGSVKQFLRVFNLPLLKAKIKVIIRSVYCKLNKDVSIVMQKRERAFSEFIANNMVFSNKYIGRKALIEGTKQYKAFILGSDQVWNPMNLGSDFYTMSFCPPDKYKITYASSFGVSQIPRYQIRQTQSYLSGINEISVRETSGAAIVKKLIDRDVPVVVDPTLLLDAGEWLELIQDERLVDEPYIFAYFVGASPEHRQSAKILAQATGYRIIGIPFVDELVKADTFMVDIEFSNLGPAEFVNLIRHAEYVCTDSFHATVFAIQHRRKFFVFDRYKANDKASMNSRLSSILFRLGLENRLVTQRSDLTQWYREEIDYDSALAVLKAFRADSEAYLNKICSLLR